MIPDPIWGCDRSDMTDVYGSDIGRLIFSAVRERPRKPSGESQGEGNRSSLDRKSLHGIDNICVGPWKDGHRCQWARMAEEVAFQAEIRP